MDTILADGAGSFKVTWPDAYLQANGGMAECVVEVLLVLSSVNRGLVPQIADQVFGDSWAEELAAC